MIQEVGACGSDYWSDGYGSGLMICSQELLNKLKDLKNIQTFSWLNKYYKGEVTLDLSCMSSLEYFFGNCGDAEIMLPKSIKKLYLIGPFNRKISVNGSENNLDLKSLTFESYPVMNENDFCNLFTFLDGAKCAGLRLLRKLQRDEFKLVFNSWNKC